MDTFKLTFIVNILVTINSISRVYVHYLYTHKLFYLHKLRRSKYAQKLE